MKVNFIIMPSLREMSLYRIAIALWSEDDIKNISSVALSSSCNTLAFHNVVATVRNKVLNLSLPEKFKSVLRQCVRQIGVQLFTWVEQHVKLGGFVKRPPTTFHWTSQGAVDNRAMAEMLVKDATIDVVNRYRLACTYCLLQDMSTLYEHMPDTSKKDVMYSGTVNLTLMKFWAERLVLKRFLIRGCNFHQRAFLSAAMSGNLSAARHFLQGLSPAEKTILSIQAAEGITRRNYCLQRKEIPDNYNTSILCFLLSNISEAHQKCLFENRACGILMCLIGWAWDVLFLELLERFCCFLHPNDYYQLLREINSKIVEGYKDQSYLELFTDVLQRVPVAQKVHVIEMCMDEFRPFLTVEEIVMLILREASEEKRVELFRCEGWDICEILVLKHSWGLLEVFIQRCPVSKEMLIHFTHRSEDRILEKYPDELRNWAKFFEICKESIQNYEKRKVEDEDQPRKKLCTG